MALACSLSRGATRRPEVRVIDCNKCGETIQAANDEELVSRLGRHMNSDHPDVDWDDAQATAMVDAHAYDATDS